MKKTLEPNTAPGCECSWRLTHNDGTIKITRGHTAFFAAQTAGWSLSECKSVGLADDSDVAVAGRVSQKACGKCSETWNSKCGREDCPRRK